MLPRGAQSRRHREERTLPDHAGSDGLLRLDGRILYADFGGQSRSVRQYRRRADASYLIHGEILDSV